MRIARCEAWLVEMPLSEPYEIAYEKVDKARNVFLRVETTRGTSGFGCAAPDPNITGETVEQALAALRDAAPPVLKGLDPLRPVMVMERFKVSLQAFPSARAAIDMALHDILGKEAGLPLWKLLGGFRSSFRTTVTLGIMGVRESVDRSLEMAARGFKALKIKGGLDAEQDVERLVRIREAVGPRIELRFDANQGYTAEQTARFLRRTRPVKLELIEQPTPSKDLDQLERATRMASIPVMADESLINLRDAFRLVRRGIADMVNIKLMKCGGITEALNINSVAKAGGYEAMVGCMDESALAIAAGLAFALCRPNVAYADLDGHLGLAGDPFEGSVVLKEGVLYPTGAPGLGCKAPRS
ncbi:MAG: dipeptide epimerase [Elusimicrobiota bacterium]